MPDADVPYHHRTNEVAPTVVGGLLRVSRTCLEPAECDRAWGYGILDRLPGAELLEFPPLEHTRVVRRRGRRGRVEQDEEISTQPRLTLLEP